MKCKTCVFFVPDIDEMTAANGMGRCYRYPPNMINEKSIPIRPDVFDDEYCGEWRLKKDEVE